MALFNNLSEFKVHVGGAFTSSVKIDSIAPFIESALQAVAPRIGDDTIEQLTEAGATGQVAIASGLLKSTVAWFAVHEYASIGNVQFTENGLQRFENEAYKSAYKYQESDFRQAAIRKAWSNFELLLKILSDNPSVFESYADSEACKLNTAHYLNFTSDFRACESRVPDRYTFESLMPYIADIETFIVQPFLGETLNNSLLSKLYSNSETNSAKKTAQNSLIKLLRRGIADMTYHLALVGNTIEFVGNRVIVRENVQNDDYTTQKTPSFELLTANYNQRRDYANRYFQRAEMFIRDNETHFAAWQGFNVVEETEADSFFGANTPLNRLKSL